MACCVCSAESSQEDHGLTIFRLQCPSCLHHQLPRPRMSSKTTHTAQTLPDRDWLKKGALLVSFQGLQSQNCLPPSRLSMIPLPCPSTSTTTFPLVWTAPPSSPKMTLWTRMYISGPFSTKTREASPPSQYPTTPVSLCSLQTRPPSPSPTPL